MNRKKIAFFACIWLILFFICAHINAQTDGFDTIKIGSHEYAIKILDISKNSQGNVEVKATGYRITGKNSDPSVKYWQVALNNMKQIFNVRPELGIYIVSNGKSVYANSYSIKDNRSGATEDAIVEGYPTTVMPSEIVFFNTNDDTQKVIFNSKTKRPKE